jgi:tetratricopeptide (TPR) repeat protein
MKVIFFQITLGLSLIFFVSPSTQAQIKPKSYFLFNSLSQYHSPQQPVFIAYGYAEGGGTEGFQGNVWDYFTAAETSHGEGALKAVNNAHLRRLHLWITQGRENDSLKEIQYILSRVPNHPRALLMAELIERLFNKSNFALNAYQKALSIFPQYALTHAQYGKYLGSVGKKDEGIKSLNHAIGIDPKLAIAHAWLSEIYLSEGKRELAESSGKMARKLGFKGKISGEPGKKEN